MTLSAVPLLSVCPLLGGDFAHDSGVSPGRSELLVSFCVPCDSGFPAANAILEALTDFSSLQNVFRIVRPLRYFEVVLVFLIVEVELSAAGAAVNDSFKRSDAPSVGCLCVGCIFHGYVQVLFFCPALSATKGKKRTKENP